MTDLHPYARVEWLPAWLYVIGARPAAVPATITALLPDGRVQIECDAHPYPIIVNPSDLQLREAL